jgi:hypothetical protein
MSNYKKGHMYDEVVLFCLKNRLNEKEKIKKLIENRLDWVTSQSASIFWSGNNIVVSKCYPIEEIKETKFDAKDIDKAVDFFILNTKEESFWEEGYEEALIHFGQ